MQARILLVEDAAALAETVVEALRRRLFVVDHARRLDEAIEALRGGAGYDVVLLDRRLPDGEGADLLAELGTSAARPRVLFLTARDTLADRVEGLEAGGDDYLVKPFEIEELVARLRALLRRPDLAPSRPYTFGLLELDPRALQITVSGAPMALPRRELMLLASLVRARGRAVLRERLLEDVYGADEDVQINALESHVSRLRTRLRLSQAGAAIRTVRGIGYQLVVDDEEETRTA